MIGPLTLKVGKALDEYYLAVGSELVRQAQVVLKARQNEWHFTARGFNMGRIRIFEAAYDVYRGVKGPPKTFYGKFWFFYYQAWIYKFSKSWRENIVEVGLRRLHDRGELERLLSTYTSGVIKSNDVEPL
jgi:hypothetical protein